MGVRRKKKDCMLVRGKYIVTSTDPDDIYDGSLKVAEGINSEIVKWDSLNSNYPDYHMVGGKNDITIPGLKNVRKHVSD